MGGMMGTAGTSEVWIILWIILGAVLLAAGIMVALVLTTAAALCERGYLPRGVPAGKS